jgi:recombination protein RecT
MAEQVKDTRAATPAPAAKQESNLALFKRTVIDVTVEKVRGFIENKQLRLPSNYSPENAMKSAWLMLQEKTATNGKPVLEACTQASISAAMLNMVVQGLNPIKVQCYFIAYGTVLACQRSYFGTMAITKNVEPKVKDFAFAVVYEGDTFSYSILNGRKSVVEHVQSMANIHKDKIVGAYAMALGEDDKPWKTEIMTIDEIHQSWKQSKVNPFGNDGKLNPSSTHGKFPADMALRTVINKLCKPIINASSDSELLRETMKKTEDLVDQVIVEEEIEEEANTGPIIEIGAGAAEQDQPEATTGTDHQQDQPKEPAARMPGF